MRMALEPMSMTATGSRGGAVSVVVVLGDRVSMGILFAEEIVRFLRGPDGDRIISEPGSGNFDVPRELPHGMLTHRGFGLTDEQSRHRFHQSPAQHNHLRI